MSSDGRKQQNRSLSTAKARLSKLSADLDAEIPVMIPSSVSTASLPGLKSLPSPTKGAPSIWRTALVGCGSNSFSQLNLEGFELNSSSLKQVIVGVKGGSGSGAYVQSISCSSNLTSVLLEDAGEGQPMLYIWGDGLPSGALRVPTPVPLSIAVSKVSCGQSHAGAVAVDGRVFTWGSGEYGATGLGTKSAVSTPKQVAALKDLVAVDISCGAFHTGIIADTPARVRKVEIPVSGAILASAAADSPHNSSTASYQRLSGAEESLTCGSLYLCGQGKAGQLGVAAGLSRDSGSSTPLLVKSFQDENLLVAKVSCGLHHTLALAVHRDVAMGGAAFKTHVYAFGWGEHGRLGVGSEDNKSTPCEVSFPSHFNATSISAGEQHSLAVSIADHRPLSQSGANLQNNMPFYENFMSNCYSWGNNSMGQLGVGSPSIAEFVMTPMQVPIPEGMFIRVVAAGGRHSAAITYCGKLLTWGWGEEGQLGHGTEKSSYLPRPVRIPKIKGVVGKPWLVSLGMSHTLIALTNPQYKAPPAPVAVPAVKAVQTPPKPPVAPVEKVEVPPSPVIEKVAEPENVPRPAVICEDNFEEEPPVVAQKEEEEEEEEEEFIEATAPVRCSIRELLQMREERASPIIEPQEEHQPVEPEPAPVEAPEEAKEEVVTEFEVEQEEAIEPPSVPSPPQETEETAVVEEEASAPIEAPAPPLERSDSSSSKKPMSNKDRYNIYYKDGQNLDDCLIANTAKRAEARRLKKIQSNGGNNNSSSNNK